MWPSTPRRSRSSVPRRRAAARRRSWPARSPRPKRSSSRTRWRWRKPASASRECAAARLRNVGVQERRALRIRGGAQLAGSICISGSKNAALPEMAAALLTKETVTLTNVPKVRDTYVMAQILAGLGGSSEGEGTAVSYTHLRAHETRHDLVCRLLLEN